MTKRRYIEWEIENMPGVYKKPRCNEFIDRQLLVHVICNVDCPDGVEFGAFIKVLAEVIETLDLFPYFKAPGRQPDGLRFLGDARYGR